MNEMEQILKLLRAVADLPFETVEISTKDVTVKTSRSARTAAPQQLPQEASPPAEPAAATPQVQENFTPIPSPIIGMFYSAPSPDDQPFVRVGDTIRAGQTLCIVEAMKLMNEIPSPESGVIRAILAQDGNEVEVGTPLFLIEKEA